VSPILEDFGLYTRVARFHNVYGPWVRGTEGGRRLRGDLPEVIEAKVSGKHEIDIWAREIRPAASCSLMTA